MGHPQRNKLKNNPALRKAYENYLLCRTLEFVVFEKPTGKKDGSKQLTTMLWPTGLSVLPQEGGVDDQSYIMMRLFSAALRGEREGAARAMKRR